MIVHSFGRALVVALMLLTLSSCGDMRTPPSYTVTTQTGLYGSAEPASQTVREGERATILFNPVTGYRLSGASGCAGSLDGSRYTTGPINADCTVSASFERLSYSLSASAGPGGSISPTQATRLHGQSIQFTLSPQAGFAIDTVSGCTGTLQGNLYRVDPVLASCSVQATFRASGASLSGTISPAVAITVDRTINDRLVTPEDNNSFSTAQVLGNLVTLHGFASAEPTGGNPLFENFANTADEQDIYRAYLQTGQLIQLQIVDYEGLDLPEGYRGDLDLYLYDDQHNLIAAAIDSGEFEQLQVPEDGDYFIEVRAVSGISKYVLRLLPATPGANPSPTRFVPGQVLVQWQEPGQAYTGQHLTSPAALEQRLNRALGTQQRQLRWRQGHPTRVALAQLESSPQVQRRGALAELYQRNPESYARVRTLHAIKALRQLPEVRYAEPNYLLDTQLTTPNDPLFGRQWHYHSIQLPQAWTLTTGVRPAGQEVIVAVIDTGVFLAHPELAGQLLPGYGFIHDPERARDGDGIDDNPDDPGDSPERGRSSWHGTHVAGTIAAASNNGLGVAGTAWGARIMPLRAIGANGGTSYDLLQSLRYAAGLSNDSNTLPERRADIINLSLGRSGSPSALEQSLYQELRALGILLVASAGNNNSDAPMYPAAYPAVLSVTATDAINQRAPYANYGPSISLAAPGGDLTRDLTGDGHPDGVLSTLVDDRTGTRQPVYGYYQGTSMAAPHVAGVLALMKAVYPELTPAQVEELLAQGELTDDLGQPGRDDQFGHGLINAYKAVRAAIRLAEGTEPEDWPPLLSASPASLGLGQLDSGLITLSNQGGGAPVVEQVTTDVDWLQVQPASVDAQGFGSYQVQVVRTGLNAGIYQGRILFDVDSGARLGVNVYIQVGALPSGGELTQLYVLLLDRETREPRYQTETEAGPEGRLLFHFEHVANGDYWIIAGSDIDVDLYICQSGESCGAYPHLNSQQPVSVQGSPVTQIDFVADILGNVATQSTAEPLDAQTDSAPASPPFSPVAPVRRVSPEPSP